MTETKLSPQIIAAVSASIILIGNGFHFGWSSPSLAKLLADDSDISITSAQGSWIVSSLQIGCICGAILALPMVDKLGRKTSLLLMSVPQFVACLLIVFAKSCWWFYLARFIAGVSIGTILAGIPMYIGEIAEDRVRGGLGNMTRVALNLGSLIPYSIGPWVSRTTLGAIGAVVPIVYVVTFVWACESPYYYAMRSLPYKIEKSLMWLRRNSDVNEELQTILNNVRCNRSNKSTITDLFMVKGNRKALGIIIGLVTCQELSGHPAIVAYSAIIFDQVGSEISSSFSLVVVGLGKFFTAIAVGFVVDKVGRRTLLLISMSLCAFFLFSEAFYFHLRGNDVDVTAIAWLPLVGVIGYLVSFSIGIGPVPIAISSEICHCKFKALAMTLSTIYLSVASICVTKFYQIVSDAHGIHVAFYVFGACSVVSAIFIHFVVPETRGRSLREIQEILHGSYEPIA